MTQGQYDRVGKPHPHKGWVHSVESRLKAAQSHLGERNPMWKGDEVSHDSIHSWVKRRLPRVKLCQRCEEVPPYDLANISGKYLRDLKDWEWLCRKCHMVSDNRIYNLKNYGNSSMQSL